LIHLLIEAFRPRCALILSFMRNAIT